MIKNFLMVSKNTIKIPGNISESFLSSSGFEKPNLNIFLC